MEKLSAGARGMIRLLAVCGSLRAVSTNAVLLKAAQKLVPAGMTISLWDGLAGLPHFNPDLDVEPAPAAVAAWRRAVHEADGLLVSSPEYARGVPGSLNTQPRLDGFALLQRGNRLSVLPVSKAQWTAILALEKAR